MGLEVQVVSRGEVEADAFELLGEVLEIHGAVDVAIDAVGDMVLGHELQHMGRISEFIEGWVVKDGDDSFRIHLAGEFKERSSLPSSLKMIGLSASVSFLDVSAIQPLVPAMAIGPTERAEL